MVEVLAVGDNEGLEPVGKPFAGWSVWEEEYESAIWEKGETE